MNESYHIDLKKISLQKFKASLKNRDLIPSRRILTDNIDENFGALARSGVKHIQDLIDCMKTKEKLTLFSQICGVPVDYLTILKREASSYHPNPIKLSAFPETNPKTIKALENIGIKNSRSLFDRTRSADGIVDLARQSGVAAEGIEELAALADLGRLYGVGPVFARIIYEIGITSVNEFVKYSGDEIIAIYEKKTQKKADFSSADIHFCLELARELEK